MASVLGLDQKHGVKFVLSKEASWAGVRDKLVNGELDFAHVLYGLVYGVHLGLGGPKKDMAVLMTLNNNGQAISLSKKIADKGGRVERLITDKVPLPKAVEELYLVAWGRRPSPDEQKKAEGWVNGAPTARDGLQDLLWVLINSREFQFNK